MSPEIRFYHQILGVDRQLIPLEIGCKNLVFYGTSFANNSKRSNQFLTIDLLCFAFIVFRASSPHYNYEMFFSSVFFCVCLSLLWACVSDRFFFFLCVWLAPTPFIIQQRIILGILSVLNECCSAMSAFLSFGILVINVSSSIIYLLIAHS